VGAPLSAARVIVGGAGIAGASCAAALRRAGIETIVRERGRAPGGRMASPVLHGRPVDVGAAYFTAQDDRFAGVVADWERRSLARQWIDTLDVLDHGARDTATGRSRWSAPGGLRALVRDLLDGVDVALGAEICDVSERDGRVDVDGERVNAVVLAMPDPQAARVLGTRLGIDWVDYEPVIAVVAGWDERHWQLADAAFVNNDPDITLIADDGARRGDGAPVLVMHTTADRARRHLSAPNEAVPAVLEALRRTLGVDAAPGWTHAHRWTYAKPAATHGAEPFALTDAMIAVAGDSWCPSGLPRVEAAWLSGNRLGAELARRLG